MSVEMIALTVGPVQANCYILHQEKSPSCIVIDPGEEPGKIADYITKNGWRNEAVLLTHGHFDHITGVSRLLSMVGGKVYVYCEEENLLLDPQLNASVMMGYEVAVQPDVLLKDHQRFSVADMDFEVIHTPGHTKGSCCFYMEEEKMLFSGDTVFMESVGRTDLPTGNGMAIIDSLRSKVLTLPSDVRIYPGHGPETSVAYEMANNPYA